MVKIFVLVAGIWIVMSSILLLITFSRFVFDEAPKTGIGRFRLFVGRIFLSLFWWFMALSKGGRDQIQYLWQGESYHE